jgi:hypothetical protein
MKYLFIFFFTILLFSPFVSKSQNSSEKYTVSGYVRELESNEDLIGAGIIVKELGIGAVTNVYGFYSITLPEGTYTLVLSFVGYKSIIQSIELNKNQKLNFSLEQSSEMLEEVIIIGEREDQNITRVQMSVENLNVETIRKIPQLFGEADVIKSLQLRPGVSSVGEGASGFNVRGGNIDQNLILLDESPVYNSSHLFGFFSVFNSDAIKDVQLYKGGIPARYGGRLSSVMDVRQREGNSNKFSGRGGIGLLFSRLTLEGPIVKNKVSWLFSARRSYADVFLQLTEEFKGNQAYFYDINTKINYTINDRHRLFLSGYFGRDIFNFSEQFKINWGNITGSLRWNFLLSDKLFMNTTVVYSNYGYALGVPSGTQAFEWNSKIITAQLKIDFTHYLSPKNRLTYGAELEHFDFFPGTAKGIGDQTIFTEIAVQQEYAYQPSVYIANEQKITKNFTAEYGLRYTMYFNIGTLNVNQYKYGIPTVKEDIIGQVHYAQNKLVKQYDGLEPRIGLNYNFNDKQSIKASYQRTKQYMHLVTNTTSATPVDVWKPAGYYVKPATADQVALGYFRNFKENMFEFSVEGYYKDMRNLLDYRDGAELLLNDNIETELLQGDGVSYGLEFMFEKVKGKFTGWIAYTISKSEMQVGGFQVGDYYGAANGINNGNPYPSNWDKTHDISVVALYEISKKWNFSATFVFVTGRPATYPNGRYYWDGKFLPDYRERNQDRIPDSHRLDLSATFTPLRNGKRWKNSFSFGVYNLYGRNNPYSVYFKQNPDNPDVSSAYQLSIIGIPVPFFTYNFKF